MVRLPRDADINEMCKVSQINVGYRALKRARLHSGETVLVNGASGITGIGTVLAALAMGAPLIIAVARNPARLERVRAIDPKRIATVALGRGESITNTVKELTNGQGASVLAELAPGGIETTIECIRNLEPGGRNTVYPDPSAPSTAGWIHGLLSRANAETTSCDPSGEKQKKSVERGVSCD